MVSTTTHSEKVVFEEKEHKYTVGDVELTSVTKFISEFFPSFDVNGMSKRVAKSRREAGEKNSKGKPITAWDVRREWNHKKEVSIARGNLVHKELEDWLSGRLNPCVYPVLHDASKQGILWANLNLDKYDVYCEEIIHNMEYRLAGTIDLLLHEPLTDSFCLGDWKSNVGTLSKKYGYCKHPAIAKYKIPNGKIYKYYLQLNVYKRLLELSGEFVGKMTIIHLADNGFQAYDVPDWAEVVDAMLAYRKEMLENDARS